MLELGLEGRSQKEKGWSIRSGPGTGKEGLWRLTGMGAGLRVCLVRGGKGPQWPLAFRTGAQVLTTRVGLLYIPIYSKAVSFLSSEFSNALEYLKLLNSFVDSVGIVTPPFSSSSVLKSALGKHPTGWLCGPHVA